MGGDILVSVIVQILIRRIYLQLGAETFLSSNKQNAGNIAPKKKGCIMNEVSEREREREREREIDLYSVL
jgi:hypothetical protein